MKSRVSAAAEPASPRRLALGLSGGGDSAALLLALREAFPDAELHALIVDHALRPDSAEEAKAAAELARQAGAFARILPWRAPQPGQGRARQARHRLLAIAAREAGAGILCLAHTLDDRIETLRMRAARPGPERRMAGPDRFDHSPVWPEGDGLVIARPFLGLRRSALRAYLRRRGAGWVDDPSNEDLRYERVRLRRSPVGPEAEQDLLRRSDAAKRARRREGQAAWDLIETGAELTRWGGARLNAEAFERARPETALAALHALMLAVSGREESAEPPGLARVLDALITARSASCAGAHLTAGGVLGRDAGAAGRADGTAAAAPLVLDAGQTGVFDGRWRVRAGAPLRIAALAERSRAYDAAPPALRPGLAAVFKVDDGAPLALLGQDAISDAHATLLSRARIEARLLPPKAPTWFYGAKAVEAIKRRTGETGPEGQYDVGNQQPGACAFNAEHEPRQGR